MIKTTTTTFLLNQKEIESILQAHFNKKLGRIIKFEGYVNEETGEINGLYCRFETVEQVNSEE